MTDIAPFTATQYDLTTCTLRAELSVGEAHFLGGLLIEMDPWRTLRYTASALEHYFLRSDPALHRYAILVQEKTCGVVCIRYPWLLGSYLELFGLDIDAQGSGVGRDVMRWFEEQTALTSRNVWA